MQSAEYPIGGYRQCTRPYTPVSMKSLTIRLVVLVLSIFFFIGSDRSDLGNSLAYSRFEVPFYGQPISIEFDPGMRLPTIQSVEHANIRSAVRRANRSPTRPLLNSLLAAKERHELNDFLFYKLARLSLQVIYEGRNRNAQELGLYKMLVDAGFDARLTFRGGRIFVNVFTNEDLFEVPIIDTGNRPYANLSCLDQDCRGRQRLYIYDSHPNPRGRSFGFQLTRWPELKEKPVDRELQFLYHGVQQRMKVTYDQTMVDIMKDYPFIHEYCYLETPLSNTLRKSLLPQLERYMQRMDEQQRLELLASFTRSAFAYKEDSEYFGKSKPMVPEELFGYSYSDCEDRSALFFALVRDLLDLPMAVVAYDDHLTVAVGSETIPGDAFRMNGQRYVFCDPTGPRASSRIGIIPPGYEDKKFTIIGAYK
jgi:hypothetical protein